ncbi:MAG: heavy metal translocating P-type ATPase [Candidatus Parabeggiatoa sp. nov. 1]|nr:MAG: heavy metal translocating P-type ATPase [Gammaproteobacteria bacterium]
MLLTTMIVVGGVLYGGKKIYQQRFKIKQLVKWENVTSKSPVSKKNKTLVDITQQANNRKKQILTRNLVLMGVSLGVMIAVFPLFPPIQFLAIPIILYASKPVLQKSLDKLKQGIIGADILNLLSILGCLLFGFYFLGLFALFIYSIAQRAITKVHEDSHSNLVDVFQQIPKSVWIIVDDVELHIPFQEIKVGDIVVVHAGEVIPADGIVTTGFASVDQQILTGEARPVDKGVEDQVFASTTVLSGQIFIQVEKAGEETTVAKVGQVLNNMVSFKSAKELRAERLADKTALPTLIAGGIAFPILGASGALAVLGSHFTNKMRMIASLSILNYLNVASKNGILIKDGRALEWLKQVDTIIFDKTGTLTEEQPTVGLIFSSTDYSDNDVLRYAVAAEYKQTHPIAKAIIQEAEKLDLLIPTIDETEYQIGYGLTVQVEGKIVRVGSKRFMEMVKLPIPSRLQEVEKVCYQEGHSLIMVAVNEQLIGAIELLPTIRPEAKAVIQQLRQLPQIKATYIISGDHEMPTRKLAKTLGIDHYFAETLPENKAKIIEELQQEGKFICYIGDGINDAIALKQSQVSISLRGASTVATDSAQIILLDKGLQHFNLLFDIAKTYNRNMDVTLALVVTPTFVGIGGAYLLGFGLGSTVFLSMFALLSGTGSAMFPLFYEPSKKLDLMSPQITREESAPSLETNDL